MSRPSLAPSVATDRFTVPASTAKRDQADGWERLATQELARSEDFRERAEEHWERARLLRVEATALDEEQEAAGDLYRVSKLAGGPVTISKHREREAG